MFTDCCQTQGAERLVGQACTKMLLWLPLRAGNLLAVISPMDHQVLIQNQDCRVFLCPSLFLLFHRRAEFTLEIWFGRERHDFC